MTTTVPAIYEGGVLKPRWPLPLPPGSEVMVTVESAEKSQVEVAENMVVWPDISERLREIYGDKVLPENPVLAARNDETY